ncbi:hypothetical protein MES4922_40231 [Mesorhizobium ventifaucium]|uniref:Transposase n=1 Tax=Mesorhizobium ventifaucium TaxID=666020 RepID=A0ABN8K7C0_9HYPH|nr:hypothetical protein MES4922_40231 [Mesorhizobium ventifaucium]
MAAWRNSERHARPVTPIIRKYKDEIKWNRLLRERPLSLPGHRGALAALSPNVWRKMERRSH